MADTIVYIKDLNTGNIIPVKYSDNGDGTYRLYYSSGSNEMSDIIVYLMDQDTGNLIPTKYVENGDGTYSPYQEAAVSAVTSVNGQAGVVVLDADDVGAYTTAQVDTVITGAKARANHTGSQLASTISDFSEAVDDRIATTIIASGTLTSTYNDSLNQLVISGTGGSLGIWLPDKAPVVPHASDNEFTASIADFTEFDVGTLMVPTLESYGLSMVYTAGAAYKVAGMYKTMPAGDLSIVTRISISDTRVNYASGGLFLAQDIPGAPTTSDLISLSIYRGSGTALIIQADTWTAYDATPSSIASQSSVALVNFIYLRIRRISSKLRFDFSYDGLGWEQMQDSDYTPGFTAAQMGLYAASSNSKVHKIVASFFRVSTDVNALTPILGSRG